MKAVLKANGWTVQTQVVVLAAGADGLKNLVQAAINSEPRSILDWFHISMRLRPIEQMATKVAAALEDAESDMADFVTKRLPNVRYQMWNGQWRPVIARMKTIYQGTCEAVTRIGPRCWRTHAAISQAPSGSARLSRQQPDEFDQLCPRIPPWTANLQCAGRVRDESCSQSAHGQAPADMLGCGRRALAASGTLRCARREIGRPIPRAVSEISPNIVGG
jgi:hypothetical protein